MGAYVSSSGRKPMGRRRRAKPMAEINVTPFVDVMLVLLIIFMVAAPLLTVGVPLELPESEANALPAAEQEPLTVNIAADGRIYLQRTPMDYAELAKRLPAIREQRQDDGVYLRADARLDYGQVAQVMGALNKAGFRSISLVTDALVPAEEGG